MTFSSLLVQGYEESLLLLTILTKTYPSYLVELSEDQLRAYALGKNHFLDSVEIPGPDCYSTKRWLNIVVVDLPNGQICKHIHLDSLHKFNHLVKIPELQAFYGKMVHQFEQVAKELEPADKTYREKDDWSCHLRSGDGLTKSVVLGEHWGNYPPEIVETPLCPRVPTTNDFSVSLVLPHITVRRYRLVRAHKFSRNAWFEEELL